MCTHVGDDDVARCLPCNDLTVEPQGLNGIFAGVVGGFIAIDGGDRMFHGMTQHNARTTFIQLGSGTALPFAELVETLRYWNFCAMHVVDLRLGGARSSPNCVCPQSQSRQWGVGQYRPSARALGTSSIHYRARPDQLEQQNINHIISCIIALNHWTPDRCKS
jgi:hypothetical protein